MKVAMVALSAFLLVTLCSDVLTAPVGMAPTACCFNYAKNQIPRKHVREYFYTSSHCPKPAVVLITRKNYQVCSNPDLEWVKQYVNYLEMKS